MSATRGHDLSVSVGKEGTVDLAVPIPTSPGNCLVAALTPQQALDLGTALINKAMDVTGWPGRRVDKVPFECKARTSATDPPPDCDWPFCGCDPSAEEVLAALDESGYELRKRP